MRGKEGAAKASVGEGELGARERERVERWRSSKISLLGFFFSGRSR